jgi:hypothetical protein
VLQELIIFWLVYLAIAVLLCVIFWRLLGRIPNVAVRCALRSLALSTLLAPGFFACGDLAPYPFLLLAIGDFVHAFISPLSTCWPQSQMSLPFFLGSLVLTTIGTLVAHLRGRSPAPSDTSSSNNSLERTREG